MFIKTVVLNLTKTYQKIEILDKECFFLLGIQES